MAKVATASLNPSPRGERLRAPAARSREGPRGESGAPGLRPGAPLHRLVAQREQRVLGTVNQPVPVDR